MAKQIDPDMQKVLDRYKAREAQIQELKTVLNAPDEEETSFGDKVWSGLEAGAKGLDYAGGYSRTKLAEMLEKRLGKEVISPEEIQRGVEFGGFPESAEMLERGGFPESGKMSDLIPGIYEDAGYGDRWYVPDKGGILDVTGRGSVGFVLDMLADPLNFISMGLSGALKKTVPAIKRMVRPGRSKADSVFETIGGAADDAAGPIPTARPVQPPPPPSANALSMGQPQQALPAPQALTVQDDIIAAGEEAVREAGLPGYAVPATRTGAPNASSQPPIDMVWDGDPRATVKRWTDKRPRATVFNGVLDKWPSRTGGPRKGTNPILSNLARVATFPSDSVRWLGTKAFEKGVEPIAEHGARSGKDTAEALYRQRLHGSDQRRFRAAKERAPVLQNRVQTISEIADELGATVPRLGRDGAFTPLINELAELVTDRRISIQQAKKLWRDVAETKMLGSDPPTSLATKWKTDLDNEKLPSPQWDEFSRSKFGTKAAKLLRQGLREGVEKSVDKAFKEPWGTGAGQAVRETNSDLGAILTAMPKLREAARREKSSLRPTWLDAFTFMAGNQVGGAGTGAGAAAARKALTVGGTPFVLTTGGTMLRDMASHPATAPVIDAVMRQKIIDAFYGSEEQHGQE